MERLDVSAGALDLRARSAAITLLAACLAVSGCDNGGDMDGGLIPPDAGPRADGGDTDDGGGDTDDGGDTDVDGGGSDPSAQIQAVLDAPDGVADLLIQGAIVTYVKPGIDDVLDGPGFFLQAEQSGPALYVNVDPATLVPPAAVGQTVELRVTAVGTTDGLRHAATIDRWGVSATGADVAALAQDVSAINLVAMLDAHTSELVTLTATIVDPFGVGGTGFTAAQITTEGVPAAGVTLRFRLPTSVYEASDLGVGCTVDIGPTPLWRFEVNAQPSAWRAEDFTVTACPAPAIAGDLVITEIGYQFAGADDDKEFVEIHNPSEDDGFDLGGCTLTGEGGSVTIPAGVLVGPGEHAVIAGSAAEITGAAAALTFGIDDMDRLELSCGGTSIDVVDWSAGALGGADDVSAQLAPSATDATMNDTLTNWCPTTEDNTYGAMGRRGTPGVANPPCVASAVLRINEVNADITQGCDLIELRVERGGSLEGFQLTERDATLVTFPTGFVVAANDIIVLHTNRAQQMCHGGPVGMAPANETTAVDAEPASMFPRNYDTAFDFYTTDSGLTGTHNVFTLLDAAGTIVDVLVAADDMVGTVVTSAEEDAAAAAAAGEWTAIDGTVPAGGFVDDVFRAHAVRVLDGTGMTESLQRNRNEDMNHMGDWTQAVSSFGLLNAGQTAF